MTNRIVRRLQPLKIVLFGSQARGDAGPWSDIDLLVVLREADNTSETAQQILNAGGKAQSFTLDVTDREACRAISAQVAAKGAAFGPGTFTDRSPSSGAIVFGMLVAIAVLLASSGGSLAGWARSAWRGARS